MSALSRALRAQAIEAANMLGGRLLHGLDAYIRRNSLVGAGPFFDLGRFPSIATLEERR